MGQRISQYLPYIGSSPPPTQELVPDCIRTVSEPAPTSDVPNLSRTDRPTIPEILDTPPSDTSVSRAIIERSDTTDHQDSIPEQSVNQASLLTSPTGVEEFIRQVHTRNNCNGETYMDMSNPDDARIKNMILQHLPYLTITRVCEVKNSFLMAMYDLKKSEYRSRYKSYTVREFTMFHATDAANVESIIQNNLDWRKVYRNKYGAGVSFSEDADYCNFHCTPRNGPRRVFIIARVLVCRESPGHQGMIRPADPDIDTAVGNNHIVYVKFNDNEFLPRYLVFYNSPDRSRSKHWVNRRW